MQWAGTVSQSGRCDDFFFRFFQPPGAVVLFPLSLPAFHSFPRLSYFTQDKSAVTVETRSHCARARCAHTYGTKQSRSQPSQPASMDPAGPTRQLEQKTVWWWLLQRTKTSVDRHHHHHHQQQQQQNPPQVMAGHEWQDWFEREEFIAQISDIRVQNLQGRRIPSTGLSHACTSTS